MSLPLMLTKLLTITFLATPVDAPKQEQQARAALIQAIDFFQNECSKHGGYVWRYSKDLTLSEGEAETNADVIWVQPYGTPSIGQALLQAYRVTGQPRHLAGALATADALISGQLQSGGWYYSITFDAADRRKWGYRSNSEFRLSQSRKNKTNMTTLDDDTTPAAVRFLMQIDQELNFENHQIHEAALLLSRH